MLANSPSGCASMISSRSITARPGYACCAASPKLSHRGQRSFPSDESVESVVSQLGDPLCRPGRLLHPPSQSVAGEDTGSGNASPRRATLSAVGHAAALAPTSAPRTAGGESPTCHHGQTTTDSVPGTDSFRLSGGADSDPTSFSQQAPTVDLQRTGAGNPRQRGISLRPGPSAAAQKAGDDSRLEQGLQP